MLLEYPLFEDKRRDIRLAFCEKGVLQSLCFDELIQEVVAVLAITKFVEATHLLGQFHHVDPRAIGIEIVEGEVVED